SPGRRVRSADAGSGVAGPQVGGVTRGSRHLWNDPCERVARAVRVRGGQDGKSGPRGDPRAAQTTPITSARNPFINVAGRVFGTHTIRRSLGTSSLTGSMTTTRALATDGRRDRSLGQER